MSTLYAFLPVYIVDIVDIAMLIDIEMTSYLFFNINNLTLKKYMRCELDIGSKLYVDNVDDVKVK